MILYDYFRSSAAYRVRIALNLKGLSTERRFVHLKNGENLAAEYLQINPQGFVPFLVDGRFALSQSIAIIEYLNDIKPEPPLLPEDPAQRALARSIALVIACDIHPLNNTRVLRYLDAQLHLGEEPRRLWYEHWIAQGLATLEEMLVRRAPRGKFCLGEFPTIADICLVPQVTNAMRFNCDVAPYPRVIEIHNHCMKLPAFDLAQPTKQPEAE